MACLCVRVEFVPSIFSSQLTARCAALSIVSGIIQQGACAHAVDTGNTTASPWPVGILSAHLCHMVSTFLENKNNPCSTTLGQCSSWQLQNAR